jgi:hypothetical protein
MLRALCAICLFIAWLLDRRRVQPSTLSRLVPQYRTKSPSPPPPRDAPRLISHSSYMYVQSERTECQPASMQKSFIPNHHTPHPHPRFIPRHSLHRRARALLHMRQVLPASGVPRRHVLLHAVGVAGRFAGRERGAGGRDAAVEAVLVEFLGEYKSGHGQGNWLEGGKMGEVN